MKILVIGFQRSGTTLLKDLIWKHPDVVHMFHEITILRHTKEYIFNSKVLVDKAIKNNYQGVRKYKKEIDFDWQKDTWGEKVPYYGLKTKDFKGWPTKYCKRWNSFFRRQSRILHIVRNPIDIGISTRNRGYSRNISIPTEVHKKAMQTIVGYFKDVPNVKHVQFEKLLVYPEELLKDIFKFCKLDYSDETINEIINNKDIFRFGKINEERAYVFKNEGINPRKYHTKRAVNALNKLDGVSYNLEDF